MQMFCLSGGLVPAAGEHTETLQEALQNPDKTWIEQSSVSRGMIYLFKAIDLQTFQLLSPSSRSTTVRSLFTFGCFDEVHKLSDPKRHQRNIYEYHILQ